MTPRDWVAEPGEPGRRGSPVDRVGQGPAHPRVGQRMPLRLPEIEEELIQSHAVDPVDRDTRQSGELVRRVRGDGVDDVDLATPQRHDAVRLVRDEADTHRFDLRRRSPVVLVAHQCVVAGAAVAFGHDIRSGSHTGLQFLGKVRGRRGDENVRHEVVEHGDGTFGIEGEAGVVDLVDRGPLGKESADEGSVDLAVHLQGRRDVLHPHRRSVRIADAGPQVHVPLVGATSSNRSARTSRGRRSRSISVRACRTPRCTVSAASNWFSLLSRLTSDRFRARLTVLGPGVPVGVAQPAAEPSVRPAPSRRPDLSSVLLEKRCSKRELVIVDLSGLWVWGAAIRHGARRLPTRRCDRRHIQTLLRVA